LNGFDTVPRPLDGTIRDDVMELFSPPRLVPGCEERGLRTGPSVDLTTGYDLMLKVTRDEVLKDIERRRPKVLVSSAPCTWFSELMRLWNMKKMSEAERRRREHDACLLLDFSMYIGRLQVERGDAFVHEHPARASSWSRSSVVDVLAMGLRKSKFDMCRFGMVAPGESIPLKKATALMSNIEEVDTIFNNKRCACRPIHNVKGKFVKHRVVQGSVDGVRVSVHAQVYPLPMCKALAGAIASYCNR
jgi:hypothetical protein